jgi:hypothetical protein
VRLRTKPQSSTPASQRGKTSRVGFERAKRCAALGSSVTGGKFPRIRPHAGIYISSASSAFR